MKINKWIIFAPAIWVIVLYLPALHFGYVWDDVSILLDVPDFRQWSTLWTAIFQPFLNDQQYFRPLALLSLGIEQILGGGSPFPSHLISVLLLAANTALVTWLSVIVGRQVLMNEDHARLAAVFSGGFYGVHPALIEAGAWISVRFDSLATLFCLAALVVDRTQRSGNIRSIGVSVLFFCALLSKEMALGCIAVLPLWHLLFSAPRADMRGYIKEWRLNGHFHLYAAVGATVIAYGLMRVHFMGAALPFSHAIEFGTWAHAQYVCKTLGQYVVLGAWPFTTSSPLHFFQPTSIFFDPLAWLGMATGLCTLVALGWALKTGGRPWLLLCAFVVSLIPVLNLIPLPLGDNFAHERFLTLPLVFIAIWAGVGSMQLLLRPQLLQYQKILISLLVIGWLVFSSMNVRVTLPFWRSDLALWTLGHLREPHSITGGINLMNAYIDREMYVEARRTGEEIRQQQSGDFYANQQIVYGFALAQSGEMNEGIQYVEAALQSIPPVQVNKYWLERAGKYLGILYLQKGQPELAAQYFGRLLEWSPTNADFMYFMAVALTASGRVDEGIRQKEAMLAASAANVREIRAATIEGEIQRAVKAAAQYKVDKAASTENPQLQ